MLIHTYLFPPVNEPGFEAHHGGGWSLLMELWGRCLVRSTEVSEEEEETKKQKD